MWQGVIAPNGEASLRYRNRAEITVFMCEQKPYPVWFSRQRKSYPISVKTESVAAPSCFFK